MNINIWYVIILISGTILSCYYGQIGIPIGWIILLALIGIERIINKKVFGEEDEDR